MDWTTLTPDVTKPMNKHYTRGRGGHHIEYVVVHHNAGTLTTEQIWQVWQTRAASAHYQVEASGRVGRLVNDADTAWHAGDWDANCKSIGIEHANATSPTSPLTAATIEAGAHLVAALCHKHQLGRPEWGINVRPHSDFTSTACPGTLSRSQRDAYMARAQEWYDVITSKPAPTPTPAPKTVDEIAREVINGAWGVGADRAARLQAAGYDYNTIQARVNAILAPAAPVGKSVAQIADEVINGAWGNGDQRINRLRAAGYDYNAVQAEVNRRLGVTAPPIGKTINQLAYEVLAGQWGNDPDRQARLTAAGHDYWAVQARVNQILG